MIKLSADQFFTLHRIMKHKPQRVEDLCPYLDRSKNAIWYLVKELRSKKFITYPPYKFCDAKVTDLGMKTYEYNLKFYQL